MEEDDVMVLVDGDMPKVTFSARIQNLIVQAMQRSHSETPWKGNWNQGSAHKDHGPKETSNYRSG